MTTTRQYSGPAHRAAMTQEPTTTTTRLVLRASVHHGAHRATASLDVHLHPSEVGTEVQHRAVARLLGYLRSDPSNGIGAYAPKDYDTRWRLAVALARGTAGHGWDGGTAGHGWVTYTLEVHAPAIVDWQAHVAAVQRTDRRVQALLAQGFDEDTARQAVAIVEATDAQLPYDRQRDPETRAL